MKLNAALKLMLNCFFIINTCMILFVAALNTAMGTGLTLHAADVLKFALVAASSTLPILLSVYGKKKPLWEIRLRNILQFLLTGAIVFTTLYWFGWVDASNAIATGVMFVLLYAGINITQELRARKLAAKLNEKINAFHDTQNASDPK